MEREVEFSKHAVDRIAVRGADCEFVRKFVAGVENCSCLPSSRPDCIILTARDSNRVLWSAICNLERTAVVTVYPAKKRERRNYGRIFGT